MFLEEMGLQEAGLDRLIQAGYALLGLQTYFTVGPKEARAWTIREGHAGPPGGGGDPRRLREGLHPGRDDRLRRLHRLGGEQGAKDAGKMRVEGKTYEVKDGDVLHFLFNA